MKSISEGDLEFNIIEKKVFEIVCKAGRELLQEALESVDRELMSMRDSEEYRSVGIRKTVIKTVMGEVSLKRRYYRDRNGEYVFLLDEALGINREFGLISQNLAEQIVRECTEKSFRKASASISELTGQHITAQGAWDVVQRLGEHIEHKEAELNAMSEQGISGQLGNVTAQVLFTEADDIWLSLQRKKRFCLRKPTTYGYPYRERSVTVKVQ